MLLKISMHQRIPKSPKSLTSWVTAGRARDRLATREGEAEIPAELLPSSPHTCTTPAVLSAPLNSDGISGELGTSLPAAG